MSVPSESGGLADAWRSRSRRRTARALSDAELAEMADICADGPSRFEVGLLSKQAEAWVLVTLARDGGKLKGFSFCTLERIGGTPCVLIGLASIKRTEQARHGPPGADDRPVPAGRAGLPRRGRAGRHPLRRSPAASRRSGRSQDIVPRPDHKATRRGAGLGPAAGQAVRHRERRLRRPRPSSPPATAASRWSSTTRACKPETLDADVARPVRRRRPGPGRLAHRLRLGHGRGPRQARLSPPPTEARRRRPTGR